MNRFRLFAFFALLLPMISFTAGVDAAEQYQEDVAYAKIQPPQPTADPAKVEVVEVFWYGCPHCRDFQPYIERWQLTKPDNVNYIRLPAVLSERWAIHARAYYTAEALGVLEKLHPLLFDPKARPRDTEDTLAEFFEKNAGIDRTRFLGTFKSFAIDAKVSRARDMTRRYGIEGTPTMVVSGKYRTGPDMVAGSFDKLINVVNYLADREAASRH
ncbi:MAG: thiol:disulfide interchange protein DsbA/DsbL [Chromatiales bacterium]|jgi:thiol:disulfide interchange protein DsbA|nr:thiol:disulfide interchange protein DsbA/DsbL [Chromatiales bacterium]